jgi:hypothetical protein
MSLFSFSHGTIINENSFVLNCISHKTQNRAQQNDASVTVDGVTLTDWIRSSSNEWPSVYRGIPQCSLKLPVHPISLRSEHSVLPRSHIFTFIIAVLASLWYLHHAPQMTLRFQNIKVHLKKNMIHNMNQYCQGYSVTYHRLAESLATFVHVTTGCSKLTSFLYEYTHIKKEVWLYSYKKGSLVIFI